jgi:hypothetical protein
MNYMCCSYQGQDPHRRVKMVVMLRQCCCGCSLKAGSSIISVTDAVSIQTTQTSMTKLYVTTFHSSQDKATKKVSGEDNLVLFNRADSQVSPLKESDCRIYHNKKFWE